MMKTTEEYVKLLNNGNHSRISHEDWVIINDMLNTIENTIRENAELRARAEKAERQAEWFSELLYDRWQGDCFTPDQWLEMADIGKTPVEYAGNGNHC